MLGSSSSGNCGLVETDSCKVLIDAGFSCKRILQMLDQLNVSIQSVDAVFFTHEHTDHTLGINGLSKFAHIKFFANRDTADAIQRKLTKKIDWQLFETGASFPFKELFVTSFSIPHDAYDPVGFVFNAKANEAFSPHSSLAWVTDLGHLPKSVSLKIREVDILVIEANHDVTLLQADTKRPWSVKQRILGRHGHLSNETTYELLASASDSQWKKIYLAHLSKDCNDTALVSKLFGSLQKNGSPLDIIVVDPI